MKTFCVYRHRSKIDGKSYIGKCEYPNYRKRWNNGKGYKDTHRFWEAIEKEGWASFEHEILFINLSCEQALLLEQQMIEKYKTADPEYGYNISHGGSAFFKGLHHSEESKKRISKKLKLYKTTNQHRAHLSESKSGVKHHYAKQVYQLSIDGRLIKTWDYMSQASNTLKINKANISSCCLGNRKTAGGYKWTYERV